ncbi:MAG TPA: hypothetical protein VI197_13320 [Polyangiaceae bacterium]
MTRPWLTLVLLLCSCCLPVPAFGLAALPAPGGNVDAEEVRLIVTAHGARSTLWVEWVLRVSGDRFLVLAPLDSGGTLDLADPAWFAAVEHATAPRVLPPPGVDLEACEASAGVHDTTSLARGERGFPRAVTTLTDPAALAAFLDAEGWNEGEAVSFADFGEPAALVALEYPALSGAPMLVQLRFEAAIPPSVWLERSRPLARQRALPATLMVLAPTPVLLDADSVSSDDVPTSWRAAHGESDYPAARTRFLEDNPGAWVTEVVGATHLFEPYYPDAQASVPAVVTDFYDRVVERGYTCPDWSEWLDAARDRDAVAPMACGSGELASLEPAACPGEPGTGSELACEGVVDLSLALSGARLNELVLTRQVGRLPASGRLVPAAAAPSHTAKLYADDLTESVCEVGGAGGDASGGAGASGSGGAGGSAGGAAGSGGANVGGGGFWMNPTSGTGASGGPWAYGGSRAYGGSDASGGSAYDDYYHDHVSVHVQAESCDCGGSSDDEACSGDSSSDTGDSSCSGDSSSDGSEGSGDSCSGDSGADVEGDTCSGASEGGDATCAGGSGDCAVGRVGFPRPRLSVVTLFLAAGVLPWRRRQRRKR